MALGDGAGRRRAGVRARRSARARPRRPRACARRPPRTARSRGRLLTSVAAGPWIRLYSFNSLPVLNAQLQAVISLQSYADDAEDASAARARGADAARGGGDAAALRHRLLDVLLAAARSVAARLPAVRRAAAEEARARPTRASPTPRRRFAAYEKQPPAFKLANAGARPAAVLALEAVDRAGRHRRRAGRSGVSLGGGWHTLAWNVPKRAGHLPGPRQRGRLGRATAPRSMRCRSCARPRRSRRRSRSAATAAAPARRAAVVRSRHRPRRPVARCRWRSRLGLRLVRFGVAWPAGATAPDPGLVAALQQLRRVERRRRRAERRRPVPVDARRARRARAVRGSLAQQVPALRDLVLAPAPSPSGVTPTAYAAASQPCATRCTASCPRCPSRPRSTARRSRRAQCRPWPVRWAGSHRDAVAFRPAPLPATNLDRRKRPAARGGTRRGLRRHRSAGADRRARDADDDPAGRGGSLRGRSAGGRGRFTDRTGDGVRGRDHAAACSPTVAA